MESKSRRNVLTEWHVFLDITIRVVRQRRVTSVEMSTDSKAEEANSNLIILRIINSSLHVVNRLRYSFFFANAIQKEVFNELLFVFLYI